MNSTAGNLASHHLLICTA